MVSKRVLSSGAPVKRAVSELPAGYGALLRELKERIRSSQVRAAVAVNRELIGLYWDMGRAIVQRQQGEGWGRSVVERLARDLRAEFPGGQGYSPQNLWYMRSFYLAWTAGVAKLQRPVGEVDGTNLPQAVGEIPWGHNLALLAKLDDPVARLWYARRAVEHGWSRAVLVHQIESGLHRRKGKALTNFSRTLPPPQSDLAQQVLKDPYVFDFLTLGEDARERDLEQALTDHVQRFLLELGAGFAFVGRQVHLAVGRDDFYLDLLFYHLDLRCFVVVELKVEPFRPEFAGKMNFYLSAVDVQRKRPEDNPTIGLLLCKGKDGLVVEYALRDITKPIGVAEWKTKLVTSLPKRLRGRLPTTAELEAGLGTGKT